MNNQILIDSLFEYLIQNRNEHNLNSILSKLKRDITDSEINDITLILNQHSSLFERLEYSNGAYSYTIKINQYGIDLITTAGTFSSYLSHLKMMRQEEIDRQDLEFRRLKTDVELGEKVVKDYESTKSRAKWAQWIAIVSLLISAATWFSQLIKWLSEKKIK